MSEASFSWALYNLKQGKRLTRRGWNGKGMYITLKPGYPNGIPCNEATAKAHNIPVGSIFKYQPFLEMKTANNEFMPWVASQSDLLADDWEIVD